MYEIDCKDKHYLTHSLRFSQHLSITSALGKQFSTYADALLYTAGRNGV